MEREELRRPYDLGTYVQLNSGDQGYIPRSEIKVLVDHPSFGDLPKTMPIDQMGNNSSEIIEKGRFTPTSKTINRLFSRTFTSVPSGWIKVYRTEMIEEGKYVFQEVQFYYPNATPITVNGFSIVIESTENITNVIVEYNFS